MEANLSIKQRILLNGILAPLESSAAKRKIINDLMSDLSLSVEEIKATQYEEKQIGTGMSFVYKPAADPMKSISFNDVVCDCLKIKFQALDKQEKIDANLLPLFEMFVPENTVPLVAKQ